MANSVYDPETGEEPTYSTPDLGPGYDRAAGDSSDPRGGLRKAEGGSTGSSGSSNLNLGSRKGSSGGSGNFKFNADGDKGSVGAKALEAAEAGGAASGSTGSADGNLFNVGAAQEGRKSRFKRYMRANRKKGLIGGGVSAGIIAVIVAGFLALIPLKIEHIVENLQNRFFATSQQAVEEESQHMLKKYLVTKVLPAYKDCGTTVSKKCTPKGFGANPVGNLYQTWSNNRLENTLAEKYGVEFKYDKAAKNWRLKAPGTSSDGVNIGKDGEGLDREFNNRSAARSAITATLNDALENETKWKKVMVRYKVGRLLEEKYGIKRCIIFCGTKDALGDKIDNKKKAAQLKLVQRVITPRTQTLGTVLECLINACDPTKTSPTSAEDGTTGALNGSPENPETDTAIREANQQLAQTFASESAEKLSSDLKNIQEKGFQKFMLEKVLEKAGLGAISSQAADAVPIIGWINAASSVITVAHNAGPTLQKLGYVAGSGGAVSLYMMYRTYADEIHTGNVDATEVGSMVNSLGSGNAGPSSDSEVGGTASAENTPLYRSLIDGQSPGTQTALHSVLPGKAYAASSSESSSNSNEYKCNDGNPVPKGKLVCSEEVLGQSNGALDSAHGFLSLPVVSQIASVAGGIHGVSSAIGGLLGSIINVIPGVSNLSEFVSNQLQPFFKEVINALIPNPFGSNMSGGRTFDMMAAGADVAGNDYAHTGLGGQVLTAQQTADIRNQQRAKSEQAFARQPLFARMFNTDSQYSLVSKLALSVPFSRQAAVQGSFANLLNPLTAVSHGFGSMLSGKALAAEDAQDDPFNVTQYGYPSGTIPDDPETYWDNHCSDNASNAYMKDNSWNDAASHNVDSKTGMPANATTNPCLLIKASVGSVGGWMDKSNLTRDDLSDSGDTGSSDNGQVAGIEGDGSGKFTTDTSHPAYPGVEQMLARAKTIGQTKPGPPFTKAASDFCSAISGGGSCSFLCESAAEWIWLNHRGVYPNPYNAPDSAWHTATAAGHAHPGDRHPAIGALLIYNAPGDSNGHVAVYVGDNLAFSTDILGSGGVYVASAGLFESKWGMNYVGWMDPYFNGKVGN